MFYKTHEMFESLGLVFQPSILAYDDQSILNLVRDSDAIACVLHNITLGCDGITTLSISDDIDYTMPIYILKDTESSFFHRSRI